MVRKLGIPFVSIFFDLDKNYFKCRRPPPNELGVSVSKKGWFVEQFPICGFVLSIMRQQARYYTKRGRLFNFGRWFVLDEGSAATGQQCMVSSATTSDFRVRLETNSHGAVCLSSPWKVSRRAWRLRLASNHQENDLLIPCCYLNKWNKAWYERKLFLMNGSVQKYLIHDA